MHEDKQENLESLYRKYAEPLYYYLLKLTGSSQLAEDFVQETFIRATISLEIEHVGQVKSWLYKVARNIYLDEWRNRKRREKIPFLNRLLKETEMLSPYGVPEETLIIKEEVTEIQTLLQFLPEKYRTILYLREYENFSYKELEESLNLSESQVKVQLYRAKEKLKELYEQNQKGEY